MITYVVRYDGGSRLPFINEDGQKALKSARAHAKLLLSQGHTGVLEELPDVLVWRGGRNEGRDWSQTDFRPKQKLVTTPRGELITHDEAFMIPEGFVDTEADKHGPQVHVPVTVLSIPRSNKEKAEWAKNYRPNNKTCLWH